jgi:hypothetical protein
VVVLVVGCGAVARAGVLGPASDSIGAGSVVVTACGSLSGIGHSVEDSSGSVTSVTFSGLPSSCNGAELSVTLTDAGTGQGAGGPVTVVNGLATVAVSPPVPGGAFDDMRLVVVGP